MRCLTPFQSESHSWVFSPTQRPAHPQGGVHRGRNEDVGRRVPGALQALPHSCLPGVFEKLPSAD
ncbi:unnamed protein product [Gulo gulo]|uniref:Uncharacterized protein n=1 Tax=Gulo gulo TaxID=48420 RepID=A0A9X9LTH4_GULGU|nr:unnamed protein product [Gulo gulo]